MSRLNLFLSSVLFSRICEVRHAQVVLSMQSFKRGMPLLPALPGEHCVTDIDAGQPLGLRRWTRFEPDDLENPKFQLSQRLDPRAP